MEQGCCGGLHFSDVLTLNLETMGWSSLATTGARPGTRDSHGAALVGHRMMVFGGTNGSKKVNDLHVLDLRTKEWTKPPCKGTPPSPRESHTVTACGGGDRLVVFGGSGEGEGNYLNDVHVLDVATMTWSSPEVKGDVVPAPRDSHGAVAVGSRLVVYGGDCGDRYHGEVDVLDMDAMAWSRVRGPVPVTYVGGGGGGQMLMFPVQIATVAFGLHTVLPLPALLLLGLDGTMQTFRSLLISDADFFCLCVY